MNVRELFDRKQAQAAAELDAAERQQVADGKQKFDLAEFEKIFKQGPQDEKLRRRQYYISHPEMQTMMELVLLLQKIEPWEDSP